MIKDVTTFPDATDIVSKIEIPEGGILEIADNAAREQIDKFSEEHNIKFWFGTEDEYLVLDEHLESTIYCITEYDSV